MPRKSRRPAAAPDTSPELPAEVPEPSDPQPAPVAPPDPARIAARLLMERALSDAGIKLEDAARDGFITVVIVRSADWSDVARHA